MAEDTRLAKSASPRELKRSYNAAVTTCAGTASSMAALIVQRQSPAPARAACQARLPGPAAARGPLDVSPNRSCFLLGTEGANSSLRSTAHILALLQEQTAQ